VKIPQQALMMMSYRWTLLFKPSFEIGSVAMASDKLSFLGAWANTGNHSDAAMVC